MASRGSLRHIIRKTRDRGPTFFLPLAGLLAGLLGGLAIWGSMHNWRPQYQATVRLRVGPADRLPEAYAAVAGVARTEEFHKGWLKIVEESGAPDDPEFHIQPSNKPELMVMYCRGSSPTAMNTAMGWARQKMLAAKPVLGESPDVQSASEVLRIFGEKKTALAAVDSEVKKLAADIGEAEKKLEGLKALRSGAETELRKADEELNKTGDYTQIVERLKTMQIKPEELGDKVGKLEKSLAELSRKPGVAMDSSSAPAVDFKQLEDEHKRLKEMLDGDEGMKDATDNHPIIRRLNQIEAIRINEDLRVLRALRERMDKHTVQITNQTAAAKKLADLNGHISITEKDVSGRREQFGKKTDARASLEREVQDLAARTASKTGAAAPQTAEIIAASSVAVALYFEPIFWPCLIGGICAGVVLAYLLRRYAMTRMQMINDPASLNNVMHAPVLGVVPRLPGFPANDGK